MSQLANISGLTQFFEQLKSYHSFVALVKERKQIAPLAMPDAMRPPLISRLSQDLKRPILLLTNRADSVAPWIDALQCWSLPEQLILRFPEPTPLPFERGAWSERCRFDRLTVLNHLINLQYDSSLAQPIIVCSPRAFLQKSLPKQRFVTVTRALTIGQIIKLGELTEFWMTIGYQQLPVVELPGQFSQRGGILDIFPIGSQHPVRIELFGDEIESLRYFDPGNQRAIMDQAVSRLSVPPVSEALPIDMPPVGDYLAAEVEGRDPLGLPSWRDDISLLQSGESFPLLEYYLPLAYSRASSLLDYLPEDSLILIEDGAGLEDAVKELFAHAEQYGDEQPELPPDDIHPFHRWEELSRQLEWRQPIVLGNGVVGAPPTEGVLSLELGEAAQLGPRYGGQMTPFLSQLRYAEQAAEPVVVASQQAQRLVQLWLGDGGRKTTVFAKEEMKLATQIKVWPSKQLNFITIGLREGFTIVNEQNQVLLHLLTDAELFGWSRPQPRARVRSRPLAPETHFSDIKIGDPIVHLEFGVGLFIGLVVRNIAGAEREYLQLEYANKDILYVPVHHADRLSKWIGPGETPVQLNRLGQKSWQNTKAKTQKAIDELADELLELYAARESVVGHAFAKDTDWQHQMENGFPHQETVDQLHALVDIKQDMEQARPMDRLICGDVGYGKTEVALRAAFKAVMDGKQVAILVPTTVLAQQHFNTFSQRLQPYPVKVGMLSRFLSAAKARETVDLLRDGKVDIVIGTHRLLSNDISFKDLGLLIIDEEQRFGVSHKERLKQLRTEVDVLTMSATPIPRTLHMGLTGVRDISMIETAPAERLAVQTYVGEVEDFRLRQAILRELERGGQIYFVHNRVQTIRTIYRQLSSLVPEAIIGIGHGQMNERELERVMNSFSAGEIDLLLSTTIIESGLDIPNANTLIVDRAENFGLSQLYQLRGRVGRGTRQAYSYFFHGSWRHLSEEAQARLEALAEYTDLGSGYAIAMRDLEIRGAGDLLGSSQSGHIASVGFDLYSKLLAKSVKKRKALYAGDIEGMKDAEKAEPSVIDLPLPVYIPIDYIPDSGLRLRLYRRMAALFSLEEIDEMADELTDRFGPIPDPVNHLLYQLRIKVLATRAGVLGINNESGQVSIRVADLEKIDRVSFQRFLSNKIRVSRGAIWLPKELSTREWQVVLVQTLERIEQFFAEK